RYTKTLLLISSNENIRKRTNAVQMLGCEIESLATTAEGLAEVVSLYLEGSRKEGPCACLFLDLDTTDFIAVVKHKPYFIRSIPLGILQLRQDPAGNAKKLADEIQKTRESYEEEEQGSPVKFFLLTGLSASAEAQVLSQALSAAQKSPVERDTLEGVLNLSPMARTQIQQLPSAAFTDVLSTALHGESLSVELMRDDLKLKKSFRDRASEMVIAGVFSLMIVAMIIGIFIVQIYFRNKCLREMREGFDHKSAQAEKLVLLSEENKMIRQFKKRRGVALKTLDEFGRILPIQMYVAEVTLNEANRFSAKGTSDLMSMVFSFVTEMENNPYFKGVTSDYTKSRKENDKDVSDFGISCNLDDDYFADPKPPAVLSAEPAAQSSLPTQELAAETPSSENGQNGTLS
ncbi:MAG: PilN domain-containing protein, partial [Candidatus Omnitrophota bacterium]